MSTRRFAAQAVSSLAAVPLVLALLVGSPVQLPAQKLPERLSDAEFWRLISDISEPGGYFRIADNFTSNEMEVGRVAGMLSDRGIAGGAYIGVGPEQNFSYIAATRPAVAFIIDIRRQAVMQHLMFKAMFELSRDRGEFISILFSRPRPAGIDSTTSIRDIWTLFTPVHTDTALATRTRKRVFDHLIQTHKFALSDDEGVMLNWVMEAFTMYGPAITTTVGQGGRTGGRGNFMMLTGYSMDTSGVARSFLSTEDNFRYVRNLQERNMIIPVSGDFAGPKALRGIGAWLTKQGAKVSTFYLSNVEQYLFQDHKQATFYANVGALPLTSTSVFIRPYSLRGRSYGGTGTANGAGAEPRPLCPIRAYLKTFESGRVLSNADAVSCVQ